MSTETKTLEAPADLVVTLSDEGGSYLDHLTPEAKRWREENAEFVRAQQEHIDEFGVFGDAFRTW